MSLGILNIVFLIICIFVLCAIFALYLNKGSLAQNNSIFIIIALVNIIVSILAFTALPKSFMTYKVLFILCAVVALIAVIVKFKKGTDYNIARLLLLISLLGTFILLVI